MNSAPSPVPPASPMGSRHCALDDLRMDNRFARLGAPLVNAAKPEPVADPRLVAVSTSAAGLLGLDPDRLAQASAVSILAGNREWPGGEPVVAIHGGHRFGRWVGGLGTPGAILLGEAIGADGHHWEIRLERSGRTAALERSDADEPAAGLRMALRAFLCSEAMHALGIPTTRALSVARSGAPASSPAARDTAVLVRLAPSFVSFGHFEHFYQCGRHDALRVLADHLIDTCYPSLRFEPHPYFALLREVTLRTARLVAAWQAAGFCHGLMHTDSMSMLGLTMGHGPFAFIEGFDAHRIPDRSDGAGRYAYSSQPGVGEGNCSTLAQAMMPLIGSVEDARAALSPYRREFANELERLLRGKLGFAEQGRQDRALFDGLFALLHENGADYTLFFRALAQVRSTDSTGDAACRALFKDAERFDAWAAQYRIRLRQEGRDDAERARAMLALNPAQVLRDHLIEDAIEAASRPEGGLEALVRLQQQLSRPFEPESGEPSHARRRP